VPRYLTKEWLEAAQQSVERSSQPGSAAADVDLVVQQIVTGGPDGDVEYHVHLDHGTVHVRAGAADDPTVTFIQSWDTAAAIARGELSAQGAFMTGLIRVRGDLAQLVAHNDVLGGVDDLLADLRTHTTY